MLPDLPNPIDGARNLLGWTLVHHLPEGDVGGIIVETEAYSQDDEASHTFRGPTKRTMPMFEEAGTLYVYFTYGMHWCMNIVTGPEGRGEAVLLRAIKPTIGIDIMQVNRGKTDLKILTNGPGKLTQALSIPPDYSGKKLSRTKLELLPPTKPAHNILASPRIGIKKAIDKPWRFYIEL